MVIPAGISKDKVLEILDRVKDPEVPVLSVVELGLIREVIVEDEEVVIMLAPTYSGCPALQTITAEIISELKTQGIDSRVKKVLSPPWTTDLISAEGRAKLKEYGIAPPAHGEAQGPVPFSALSSKIPCPRCDSLDTECVSEFGATACKAMYVCKSCKEPFEYFKALK